MSTLERLPWSRPRRLRGLAGSSRSTALVLRFSTTTTLFWDFAFPPDGTRLFSSTGRLASWQAWRSLLVRLFSPRGSRCAPGERKGDETACLRRRKWNRPLNVFKVEVELLHAHVTFRNRSHRGGLRVGL